MASIGSLEIRGLTKRFAQQNAELSVLEDIDITVDPGSFVSIVGPSGCGKSTLLKLIVGLDAQYSGEILLDGEAIRGPNIRRGLVFQDHRLLPWLTIEENVGFGLNRKPRADRQRIVREHMALVGLTGFEKSYPYQLSGGMAQRAAIARALASRPEILLLDEPLGALDALTRIYLQLELEKIWKVEGITMVMVTHDIDEAIFLSDTILVMSNRPGKITKRIQVPIPRPRDRASFDFVSVKAAVLKEFHLDVDYPVTYAI